MPFLKGVPHKKMEESWAYVSLSLPYLMKAKAFYDAHFTSRADHIGWRRRHVRMIQTKKILIGRACNRKDVVHA